MHSVSKYVHLSEPTAKIWMKIDPYCQQWRCWPMTLVSDNIRSMRYSWGFPGEGASNDSGVIENIDFRAFGEYFFGTFENEANIITQYYLVPCRLSTDPKIHDHEWPWMAILRKILTITKDTTRTYITYLSQRLFLDYFLLLHVTSRDVWKWNIWDPQKNCGSFIDEKL